MPCIGLVSLEGCFVINSFAFQADQFFFCGEDC